MDDEFDRIDLRADLAELRWTRKRRERMATAILAALIARPDGTIQIHGDAVTEEDETYGETLPRAAVRWADCLIKVLEK